MKYEESAPDACEAARQLAVTALYEELDSDEARELRRHLDGCHACRDAHVAHREVIGALATWSPDEMPGLPRRRRWLRVATIAAAGVIGLALLGTRVAWTEGSLVLSFRALGGAAAHDSDRLRTVAAEEANQRIRTLGNQLRDALVRIGEQQEARRLALAVAVDDRLAQERERMESALRNLARMALGETTRMRDALGRLTAFAPIQK